MYSRILIVFLLIQQISALNCGIGRYKHCRTKWLRKKCKCYNCNGDYTRCIEGNECSCSSCADPYTIMINNDNWATTGCGMNDPRHCASVSNGICLRCENGYTKMEYNTIYCVSLCFNYMKNISLTV